MDISAVRMGMTPVMAAGGPSAAGAAQEESFGDMLKRALGGVAAADYGDKSTNIALMTGILDDMHTATIAAEKADIVLQLTLQIRNKAVDAYNEIMRMQI